MSKPQARALSRRMKATLLTASALGGALILSPPAYAQGSELSEIVVTARKRQESILNVPVVATALPQERLDRLQVNNLQDVVNQVPGLLTGPGTATSGLLVSLRGVGTTTNDPAVDQSISLIVDGLQFSQGIAYAAGMFDVGQVEVLKGPQSLFYGKSSPGGVISLRTADPTNQTELIGRLGYEPEARQRRAELIVSGPVSDTLKLRLAGMYDKADGYYYNHAKATPGLGGRDPKYDRLMPSWSYIVRGTALWAPSEKFDARLKVNAYGTRVVHASTGQLTSCPDGTAGPFGIPFIAGDDCKLNRTVRVVDVDPAAFPDVWYGGTPQMRVNLQFGTLELNYRPLPDLTLTSTTGYYRQHARLLLNATNTTDAGPPILVQNGFDRNDFTQEFRANSDFSGPLNFTAGAYYQDAHYKTINGLPANMALGLPRYFSLGHGYVFIYSYSVFGQARWAVTDKLELAAGARWINEIRKLKAYNEITGQAVFIPVGVDRLESKRLLPELTVTYRPSDTLTVFGSLKKGAKSGNFNAGGLPAPGGDSSYGDEKVVGGEVGMKSRLLDRRLALEVAAYHYKYTDLQVGINETNSVGVPIARTVNAGSAKVYGIDFTTAYRPQSIEGLTLNLNAAWNKGEFKVLNNIPCWFGQTIAEGCNQQFSTATGLYNAQDLSNSPMPRAPRWQVNFGFDWERPIGEGRTLSITNNNSYVSRYQTFPGLQPQFFQDAYLKADLSLALRGRDDRWEVAVIGKNITGKITASSCSASNLANGAVFGPEVTGGVTRGLAGIAETTCRLDQGREVWLRLTVRPFN